MMPLRIYIAPKIGSGLMLSRDPSTWSDTTGPYRNPIMNYISADLTTNVLRQVFSPAWGIFLSVLEAPAATHDALDADSRIVACMPQRASDRTEFRQMLNAAFLTYPLAWRTVARNYLEAHGVNTEWITGSHSLRNVLGHVFRLSLVAQMAEGQGKSNVTSFLKANLDSTIGSLPAAVRNDVSAWLSERGVSISGITGTTTVRQALNIIAPEISTLYGRPLKMLLFGEEF